MDSLKLPLDYAAIERILPHRYPFLLVDRITEFEADKRHLEAELDGYMAGASETKCGYAAGSEPMGYFLARSALRLGQAAAEWSALGSGTERPIRDARSASRPSVLSATTSRIAGTFRKRSRRSAI